MKKTILILLGILILLSGVIFVLYKNNQSKNEEVIDIFKEKTDEELLISEDKKEDKQTKKVFVDIKGMVTSPGVYEVDSTSRVNDVINIAGGLLEGADTSYINLAKIVTDEMTIIINSKEEILEKYKQEVCICNCPEITNDACIENNNSDNKLININTAAKEELTKIPGIGDAKAYSIIKYREENGIFNSIDDIKKVTGIGETLFEEIKMYITV